MLQHFNNAIIRSLYKDSWENFCGALENHEKRESLAQRIFPRLWYSSPYEVLYTSKKTFMAVTVVVIKVH